MKTTRGLWGAALIGTLWMLQGCGGAGTYQIPNVEPVVKPKPEDDLLEDIEGNDKPSDKPAEASKPADAPKPAEAPKPTDAPSATPAPADAPKPAPAAKTPPVTKAIKAPKSK